MIYQCFLPFSLSRRPLALLTATIIWIAFLSGAEAAPPESSGKSKPLAEANTPAFPPVQIIGASWCPLCLAAEEYFRSSSVPYRMLDIDHDRDARSAYLTLGGGGVPIIIVGTEVIRGFDRGLIDSALHRLRAR